MSLQLQDAARAACAEVGILYRDVPADGRFHPTDIEGDPSGKGDGRIKYFPDGEGGIALNWKGEKRPFFADDGRTLTDAERRERDRKQQAAIKEAEAEEVRRHAEAAKRAAVIWDNADDATDDHPYLRAKGVKAHGARIADDGRLVVAVKLGAEIQSLQFIAKDGTKRFLTDGKIAGGYFAIGTAGEIKAHGLAICEGFATGASIREATGLPVVVAFNAGNLRAVAEYLRGKFSNAHIVVAGDFDASGTGQRAAAEAAQAVAGIVALPAFTPEELVGENPPSDWNDFARLRGLGAVKTAITTAQNVGGGGTAKESPASSNSGVTEVTGVQASNGAASGCTPDENDGVTGVTKPPADAERPCFRVFDKAWKADDKAYSPGVWYFGSKPGKRDEPATLYQLWICSPLYVEAVTFDGQDKNFGRELRFKTTTGRTGTWAMPMEMLAGDGAMLRAELLSMGVEIDPTPTARNLLASYLQAKPPKRRKRCALQTGWNDGSFVLPDTVIGPNAEGVIFQSGECSHDEHTVGGTPEGWQSEIAARAVDNPMLALALSAAFAGPMLKPCNAESGGIHFIGNSSIGKTTATDGACSTWGDEKYRRSWRATANGMEGAAARFNDCLLALDDVSEADPKEVGAIVYSLGNGTGKQRAGRTGSARAVVHFRCMVLSNGERTIETTMAEGGYRAKAGQGVRMLDIPAERRFGIFDELHGFPDGAAFSDAIKKSAARHHGHAGRAFLQKLTHDKRDFPALLERIKALKEFSADGAEGQDKRAAGRFAMLALAGELATEYRITGWPEGEAIKAAAIGFTAWRSIRGKGSDERRKILEQVSGFIDRHGDGRFSDAEYTGETSVRDRAGWWRDSLGERLYLFTADGLKEALKGFDFKRALDTLQEAGALPAPGADGKRAKAERIKARGAAPIRLYTINPEKLGGDHGA